MSETVAKRADLEGATSRVPHPIPYQGSKRLLAGRILAHAGGRRFERFLDPFAGSGAMTLRAASLNLADRYVLGDSLGPLVAVFEALLDRPESLEAGYRNLWSAAARPGDDPFFAVRDAYNREGGPARLLYLLARCVKNSPRWNQKGDFNQAPDRRRQGVHPDRMRRAIFGARALLGGRARAVARDFTETLSDASPRDLVYLDPPFQGTTTGKDRRYHEGLDPAALAAALAELLGRGVPFLLSYDGRCGDRSYGDPLPASLGLVKLEIRAGRSSQATLLGRCEETYESLYISPHLIRLTSTGG